MQSRWLGPEQRQSPFVKDTVTYDAQGNLKRLSVTYSFGPNGLDERGGGDDVTVSSESPALVLVCWMRPLLLVFGLSVGWYGLWYGVRGGPLLSRGRVALVLLVASAPSAMSTYFALWILGKYTVHGGAYTGGGRANRVEEFIEGYLFVPAYAVVSLSLTLLCLILALLAVGGRGLTEEGRAV